MSPPKQPCGQPGATTSKPRIRFKINRPGTTPSAPQGTMPHSSPKKPEQASSSEQFPPPESTSGPNAGFIFSATTSHLPARSSSPISPPTEPLSPVLGPSNMNGIGLSRQPAQTYTHTSQAPQTFIPQPPPQPIDFATNPDAIALQATISILQIQKQTAERNIRTLAEIKDRARAHPADFLEALKRGEIKSAKKGAFDPAAESDDDDDDEGDETAGVVTNGKGAKDGKKVWPTIPALQNVVQVPSINWEKYGVVGDSLDKLHEDQVKHPSEGKPAMIKADGTIVPVLGGRRGDGGPVARPVGVGEGAEKIKRGGMLKK